MNSHHKNILSLIKQLSGKPTKHTFVDSYLGNTHMRYPINNPVMRTIAKEWIREHKDLSAKEFVDVLTSLIEGESSTEKLMAGFLMDYCTRDQRKFDPKIFDQWLDHLIGWVEVDTLCTSKLILSELPQNISQWNKWLTRFSKSKNINKRRASLVLLCSPVGHHQQEELAAMAFQNIDQLKKEKEILITKAISWLLRSMIKHYKEEVRQYVDDNADSLPKIAVRETRVKLETGKKNPKKKIE